MSERNDGDECRAGDQVVSMFDAVEALGDFGPRYRAPLTGFDADDDGDGRVRRRPRRGERSVLFTPRRAVHEGDHHLLAIERELWAGRSAGR
ncbi:MAG: hypothetical protein M3P53_01980 [Actinomycetota bacterium]|nr:hypothetical protein [Actinomycetota bacterium]